MPQDKGRQMRLKRAKRRVQTLINQGVPFNPAGASDFARQHAAGNARRQHESRAAASIRSGGRGTARAPKGGPVTFR